MIPRRKLLLYAGAALGSATIASSIMVAQWWNTAPQEPYTYLNKDEAVITLLIAKAALDIAPEISPPNETFRISSQEELRTEPQRSAHRLGYSNYSPEID